MLFGTNTSHNDLLIHTVKGNGLTCFLGMHITLVNMPTSGCNHSPPLSPLHRNIETLPPHQTLIGPEFRFGLNPLSQSIGRLAHWPAGYRKKFLQVTWSGAVNLRKCQSLKILPWEGSLFARHLPRFLCHQWYGDLWWDV